MTKKIFLIATLYFYSGVYTIHQSIYINMLNYKLQ